MSKLNLKQKILRFFMLSGGIIFFAAGLYAIFEKGISQESIINNLIFFLVGAALTYSGLKWTGKEEN